MTTTIQISDKLWDRLNNMKRERGETFEDVIWKALNEILEKEKNSNGQ